MHSTPTTTFTTKLLLAAQWASPVSASSAWSALPW